MTAPDIRQLFSMANPAAPAVLKEAPSIVRNPFDQAFLESLGYEVEIIRSESLTPKTKNGKPFYRGSIDSGMRAYQTTTDLKVSKDGRERSLSISNWLDISLSATYLNTSVESVDPRWHVRNKTIDFQCDAADVPLSDMRNRFSSFLADELKKAPKLQGPAQTGPSASPLQP